MKKFISLLVVMMLAVSFAGCSSGNDEESIIIYDGTFSEMKIVHQMAKLVVEDHTDATVDIRDEMSDVNSFNELVSGGADMMNAYDGTLLTTYLKLDISDVPVGSTIYDYSNKIATEEKGVHLMDKLGSENTYAIGVLPETAEKYNLKTVSDLAAVSDQLIFGAEHGFYTEEGSMKYTPFIEFYGLNFKESKPIDIALKYSAIENKNIDVTMVYTTDGLNKKAGLVILEDDRQFFPEYNDALLVRNDLFERFSTIAPNLEEVLNTLGGAFTDEIMTNLTYEVDVNGRTPEDVAHEFLLEKGLISK
ncbi:glycine betaine ABC transporter substrate-binding protein [Acetobacterium bakii]|uniref:Glycine/betaine ABC transporter substrate-binding protein n=1 Tax=Acetobacterium bakii TaxID=52689 RepID=A0A0L6TZ24_9FIRM|nr:glycine betaine ABC transporter substrate-binding protein [Acetobacterium bakii]KNZ41498.1 glycine/betaine ABC transporter substrate-binding protein [Acetobacterium bakii]